MGITASAEIQVSGYEESTRVIQLSSSPFMVGRSETAALPLPQDTMLSRLHFALEFDCGQWHVRDMGSKNGTSVNGESLRDSRPLQAGDTITAGRITVIFEPRKIGAQRRPAAPLEFVEDPGEIPASSTVMLRLDPKNPAQAVPPASSQTASNSARRFDSLVKAGKEIASLRTLEELFDVLLDLSLHSVEATRGVLMTFERGVLVPRAHRGEGFRISAAVRDRVIQERASLLVQDTSLDAQFRSSASIVQQRVSSFMAVPLQTDTQVIGLLYVDSATVLRSFDSNDLSLLTILANIAAIRIEHARLLEVEQAERFMMRELDQAAEIQRGLLPCRMPAIAGIDLAGQSVPCKLVGGDYFDYFPLPDGRLAVVIADVAGKGLSAALLMSNLQARVQALMEIEFDLARLVSRLNNTLKEKTPGNKFITAFFAVIDPRTGQMIYTNAGHNPPVLVHHSGEIELLSVGGPVLGILPNVPFLCAQATLAPGENLVMYSDGVSEAPNKAGEEFGEESIARIAAACRNWSASETLLEITHQLHSFLGNLDPADDMTLLVMRRTTS